MKKRSIITLVIYLAVLAALFSWVTGIFGNGTDDVPYSKIVELLEDGQVKTFVVEEQKQLFPGVDECDGFFYARLRRI